MDELRALLQQKDHEHQQQLTDLQAQIERHQQQLDIAQKHLCDSREHITEQQRYIAILEEYLRLAKAQKYGPSSEKLAFQVDLFDEAELEVSLSELESQLREEDRVRPPAKRRQRGFSPNLPRVRIEFTLSDEEKAGAVRTFFTKVKEELEFIPAKLQVLEYWQERAVFEQVRHDPSIRKIVVTRRRLIELDGEGLAISSISMTRTKGGGSFRTPGICSRISRPTSATRDKSSLIPTEM